MAQASPLTNETFSSKANFSLESFRALVKNLKEKGQKMLEVVEKIDTERVKDIGYYQLMFEFEELLTKKMEIMEGIL